jgi:RNA polymerase sigma factor (sigma-70 family)
MDMNDLCTKYHSRLFYSAYHITNDYHLAQDVVQETLWKAYQKMETLQKKDKIGSWLTSISIRTALDVMRKRNREATYSLEGKDNSLIAHQNVEDEVDAILLQEEIEDAINQFPTESKEIFLLKTNEGMMEREIAELLHIKEGTIKTRIYRARQQLKSILV